jgi:hypothetical protein
MGPSSGLTSLAATSTAVAAVAAAATSAAPEAATSAAVAAVAAAASAAAPGEFFAELRFGIFLVEDIERRQAYVGDFFITEKDFMTR